MLALVLSRRDFREDDQMVGLFTLSKGKIDVIARGVKKIVSKNSPHLEPFSLIEAEIIKGRELDRLASVQPVKNFKNIRLDLAKSRLAGYAAIFLDKLLRPGGVGEEKLFGLFLGWLEFLAADQKTASPRRASPLLLYSFILKTFFVLGLAPVLDRCVRCGRLADWRHIGRAIFSPVEGGLAESTCPAPHPGRRIKGASRQLFSSDKSLILDANDIKLLRLLAEDKWPLISRLKAEPSREFRVKEAIRRFAEHHTEAGLARFSEGI